MGAAFETWRLSSPGVQLTARLTTVALAVLATADLIADIGPLRQASWIAAVLLAGSASLLAVAAAEPAGVEQSMRWHLQGVASAVIMFMLMANAMQQPSGDVLWFLVVVGAASTLVAMATSYRDASGSSVGGICLALDSAIVGFTTALMTVVLANPTLTSGGAAILLGAFAAAGYAVAVATRPTVRAEPRGSDALFLGGVLVLCLNAVGEAARQIGFAAPAVLAAPGVALFGALGLARSAWSGPQHRSAQHEGITTETRLRLVPTVAAAGDAVAGAATEVRYLPFGTPIPVTGSQPAFTSRLESCPKVRTLYRMPPLGSSLLA